MDLNTRLEAQRQREKAMTLIELIADVESRHFRTGHDTGANDNAMFVWNIIREYAGLDRMTIDDLIQKHADDKGISFEEMKEDYDQMERVKILVQTGMSYAEAFDKVENT